MTFKPATSHEGILMQRHAHDFHLLLAYDLNYKTVRAMYEDLYIHKNMSLNQIEKKLGVSYSCIRRLLKLFNIRMRPRGGKNHVKIKS